MLKKWNLRDSWLKIKHKEAQVTLRIKETHEVGKRKVPVPEM